VTVIPARLYYTDSYLATFEASIAATLTWQERPAVVLDRTAFYPTSGGQPHDTGDIGGVRVLDVVDDDEGRVVHVMEGSLPPDGTVECRIDWNRRFDHMQQHTGQHVLSAALARVNGARTESFHFGVDACTIDVSAALNPDSVARAGHEANRVVWSDVPVHVRFVDEAEAARMPLRKPPARGGLLRVVDVENVDLSACGGTHVRRTGEIGLIGIASVERYKGGTRIEFVCGGRALSRFELFRDMLASAARHLGCAVADVPAGVDRLQNEAKQQRQTLRLLQQQLAAYQAERLRAGAVARGDLLVVAQRVPDADGQALKGLASAIASEAQYVAILVGGEPANVVVARGPGAGVDAASVIRSLTSRFGGRGGGRPELAQAGGLDAAPDQVLAAAVESL
jgi:alanyl-tRNA synthetase